MYVPNNIDVRTSDAHSIIDIKSENRKNIAQDAVIGHHLWVSARSLISKDSKIPNNCIIGANSIVTKSFDEENCTIAGAPAKIVSKDVTWDKKRI
ncbi:hypothetical protein P4U90_06065 [Cytobacillus kochii]|uniref:acyltransferase n=1 Tax=Cytobacillus kochii TaxID=859143 RepID=UPI002E1D2409|nr:hypothetical protein [Cytobacillus kochii]